jgi:hypothetical protein
MACRYDTCKAGASSMQTCTLSAIVNDRLQQGVSPRQVRLELSARGVRWRYGFTRVQGPRERVRNLRRAGLKPCEGCGHGYLIADHSPLCPECLVAKWTGGPS